MEGLGEDAPRVMATVRGIGPDLQLIDRALARARADPTEANLTPCPWSTPTTASGWPGSWPRRPCARG